MEEGAGNCKIQRTSEIESSRHGRNAVFMKSQQDRWLNKTNTLTIPVHIPAWMRHYHKAPPLVEEVQAIRGY